MSKRVLITGGAGFISSHLADELLEHGYRVRALDVLSPQVHGPERKRPEYLDPEVEWFRVGEYERGERVLADLKAVGVQDLRINVSWADWCTREGQEWYAWLFPRLAEEVTLLPCFLSTPPSLGVVPKPSSPPRAPKAYADFLDLMITRFGAFFDHIELWNQPSNLADRLLSSGRSVTVSDNLSRPGVDQNLRWLRERHGDRLHIEVADIRDRYALRRAVRSAQQVYHFAVQVAVTTSLTNPVLDFEVNACGTLNLLEALRSLRTPPPLVFTSTNKVYGDLSDIRLGEHDSRYEPEDLLVRRYGINETARWTSTAHMIVPRGQRTNTS